MPLKLVADMNISPVTVKVLVASGWDCVRVSDVARADTPDEEILLWARNQARIVVTQDLDFSTLLALGGYAHPSLITLRLSVPIPEAVTRRVIDTLLKHELALSEGCAITITDRLVRIRRLPLR